MNLVNLTPHDLHVYDATGKKLVRTIERSSSGEVARLEEIVSLDFNQSLRIGVPVQRIVFGAVKGLPPHDANAKITYIVSMAVGQAVCRERPDVVCPDTSERGSVRDPEGRIIGTKGFVVY